MELHPQWHRVLSSICPQRNIGGGSPRVADAGLRFRSRGTSRDVRSEENLTPSKRGASDVLGNIVVVADQDATLAAQELEDSKLIAAREVRVQECVQLAVARDDTIGRVCAHVRVVQSSGFLFNFEEPGEDRDPNLKRDLVQLHAARPRGYKLRQRQQLFLRRILQE
eukprot:COSAG02_NODE_6764_length_3373_cov_2.226940_1_plen_167_part_00